MLILNLADQEKSTIPYQIVSFSDSQKLVNLMGKYEKGVTNVEHSVTIYSHMSWDDLQLIICANQALREAGFKYIHLYVPYFLGARSDRKFKDGGVNYLKAVICPIINAQQFASVTVMDPHSNCLEMGLNNFKKLDAIKLAEFALEEAYGVNFANHVDTNKYVIVGPDKGSYDRVSGIAKHFQNGTVLMCDKHRDILTGQILSIDCGNLTSFKGRDVFIFDDICDGGGTFIPIAEECKKRGAKRVFLVITHGIFSKGLKVLSKAFDGIFTTNSVHDFQDPTSEFVMFNENYLQKVIVKNVI